MSLRIANGRGFSLLEVILVVAVLAIVAAVAVPTIDLLQVKERSNATVNRMQVIERALQSYFEDELRFPDALSDLETAGYLGSSFTAGDAFLDGWGNGFAYEVSGETVTLTSLGPDQTDSARNIELAIDGTRFLISATREEMNRIDIALRNYESRRTEEGLTALPETWFDEHDPLDSAMGRLIDEGFLPNDIDYATDAWGVAYTYAGTPSMTIRSPNLGSGGASAALDGGSGGGGHGGGGGGGDHGGNGGGDDGDDH